MAWRSRCPPARWQPYRRHTSGRWCLEKLPTAAPAAATPKQPDDQKQHDGTDSGVDDRADNPHAKVDTDARQQPIADERADNADDQVTDQSEAGPLDNLTGQPPGDETDKNDDKQTFV